MTHLLCFELRNIRFAYDEGPLVLKDISLSIEEGDFIAIIGQNGSGKTTLTQHLNGLLRPSQGQVLLYGEDIHNKSVGELACKVGYVFQNPDHQIFSATIFEEIVFGPKNLMLSEDEIEHRAQDALQQFGLVEYAKKQPALLSFGLRRKVSIAAVYAMQTPILILDEPTTGLDRKTTTELMELISSLNRQGRTIIVISHDMRIVAEYIPRCMVVSNGKVVTYGETRDVFRQMELLQETNIHLPQITELARRMSPYGLPEDILTVQQFCDYYQPNKVSNLEEASDANSR